MKTKITMIVLFLVGWCSFAQVGTIFASGGLNYEITSGTTVKVGENPDVIGAITIPSSVKYNGYTYQVTSIGSDAFYDDPYNNVSSNRSNLTSVSIPNSVISIGDRAFYYCWNLTSVNIPTSVTNIGAFAFSSCGLLTSIVIPNSVVSIGSHAFYSSGLVSVSISNSLQVIPQGAFSFCRSLTSVSIPNSVIGVGAFAFGDCVSLTAVILPNTLSTIKRNCFENCVNLTSINIPSSISTIEERAFQNCTSLTSVTVDWPNPLPIIRNVFANVNLSNVMLNVPGGTFQLYDVAPVWTEFAPIIQPFPIYTSIPDANFEQALFDQGIDAVNGDHRVLTSAIVNLTTLDVSNKSIADLTGIASFTALTELNCEGNRLSSLNIATVVLLEKLNCNKNQIAILDLSNQSFLRELRCQNNLLTTINIAGISHLQQVYCSNNLLTSLDFSTQTNLRQLYCNNNQLTTIDIKNQEPSLNNFNCQNNLLNNIDLRGFYVLADFNCTLNPNLNCITVDDVAFANANFLKDTSANFSTNCYAPLVLNYCVGTPAVGLASPYAANVATRWYTVAVGGRFSTTAPTPSTNTVGTRIFYVSQVLGGIESARIAITVNTVAVPAAPASITGIAAPSIFVGTTTTVAYVVAPVANATSYNWTVPAGVNIVSGQGTTTLSVNFNNVAAGAGPIGNLMVVAVNAQGCSTKVARTLALTKALPTAPIAIRMTDATLAVPASGIATAVTNISRYIGQPTVLTLTATPVAGVSNYEWELPAGVNVLSGAVATRGGAFGSNVITVNFAGISASGMFSYTTTSGILTYLLRVGVKAVSGVGASTTSNASLINPGTTSTTRLLTLTAVAPRATTSIRMTDAIAVDPTRAITVVSTIIGTPRTLTLTATPVATASAYSWELPAGVKQLSGGSSNVITVNFADVVTGTTSLYLGVKAINALGESVTSNASLVPATSSTARLLRLSATVPAAVPAVIGQVVGLCGKNFYNYTISPSALATSYQITAPAGAIVTSKSKELNKSNVINTSDLEFVVTYPEKFFTTKQTPASLAVWAMNGIGQSTTARILNVSSSIPTPTDLTYKKGKGRHRLTVSDQVRDKLKRTSGLHKAMQLNEQDNGFTYIWSVSDGAELVSGQGTGSIEIDYSKLSQTAKSIEVTMYIKNSCGVLSLPVTRTFTLELIAAKTAETLTIEATEIYPNPVVDDFAIDVTASKVGALDIAIYSLEGIQVANSKTFAIKEGLNTITENVSNLAKGIYIVQLLNSSNKELITKKLIKN